MWPTMPLARSNMLLALEPAVYSEGEGGLRVKDNFLITAVGPEQLSPFPDGIVQARSGLYFEHLTQ